MPKSVSLTRGWCALREPLSRTFPGLMSRWITPRAWAWARASSRSSSTARSVAKVSARWVPSGARQSSTRVPCGTSSITRKGAPAVSSSPLARAAASETVDWSNTVTIPGWSRAAAARTSSRNAAYNAGSDARSPVSTLIATAARERVCTPRKTRPIPPRPISAPSSNGPSCTRGFTLLATIPREGRRGGGRGSEQRGPELEGSWLARFCVEKQRRSGPQPKGPGISAPSVRGAAVSRPQLANGDP
jgi:hypothetical protein